MVKDRNQAQTGASNVSGKDRLKTAAIAMAGNQKLHVTDMHGKRGTDQVIAKETVESLVSGWPKLSKEVTNTMIEQYGLPNEATETRVVWHYNSPWKKTIVYRDGYTHDFPEPHVDMLEQIIDYHVPAERMGELSKMEGSVIVDRTKGEVSVHCDNEGANTLSVNMMHEIVTGKRTADEAREKIASELPKYLLNQSAPYAEKFQFELANEEQGESDQSEVQDKALETAVEKAKDALNIDK